MLATEIVVGGIYSATISKKLTKVVIKAVDGECYTVLNLSTKRTAKLFSASAFSPSVNAAETIESKPEAIPVTPVVAKWNPPSPVAPNTNTNNQPHIIISAGAGCGKTTTVVGAVCNARGMAVKLTPSAQQRAIWDAVGTLSSGSRVAICAFGKGIADELQTRVPMGVDAMTINSFGFRIVKGTFKLNGFKPVNKYRLNDILAELIGKEGQNGYDLWKEKPVLMDATKKLVDLVKQNLTDTDPETLGELAGHYEIDMCQGDGASLQSEIFELVPRVINRCKDMSKDKAIDFVDQIWLPVVLNLPIPKYDLLLIDEAQDLNRCQQALVKRAAHRLVFCGDPNQAIYGFAGADAESMDRLESELGESSVGVVKLPLNETRRCGKAIVREANEIVPEFYAHESNPEGTVTTAIFKSEDKDLSKSYHAIVNGGDMLICRVNAPLVNECFKFLKMGKKANILGRDVGERLVSLIKKQKADSVTDLIAKLAEWLESETKKENQKKRPDENKLINMQDRVDCIYTFCEDTETIAAVINRIDTVFTDDKNNPGIRLSSIHKAKGLEASRVFLLEPKGASVPHPMAKSDWQIKQEWNLRYVAITRAIDTLVYVR